VDLVTPFGPELFAYDPFANAIPDCCRSVGNLDELFSRSEAVAIHAGLTDATRRSVTAELLAKLPDHGILINTARGDIVDQEALFAELKSGRLRAGLDVLDNGDCLPPDHEARLWPNLVMTAHDIYSAHWPKRPARLSEADEIAVDNLKRFVAGKPLQFVVDEQRYALST
jgi:phosphoglycerate dehydrogenase-like enzyme